MLLIIFTLVDFDDFVKQTLLVRQRKQRHNVAQNKLEKNMTLKTGTSLENRGKLSVTKFTEKGKYTSLVYFTGKLVQTTAEKKPDKMD